MKSLFGWQIEGFAALLPSNSFKPTPPHGSA
ncbi:hypothetical protein FHT15_002478 [Xanthomonas campestris]